MKRVVFIFVGTLLLLTACTKSNKETVFKSLGRWENPPVYNGNPYAPGGVGHAVYYIYGKLALYKPLENEFQPYLAESWTEENNKLTVKIKDGIFWDDGEPFTSKDVQAQFIISGGMTGLTNVWDYLESIETPDTHTVVFNFDNPGVNVVKNYILTEPLKTPYHVFEKWYPESFALIEMRKENLAESDEFADRYKKIQG